MQEQTEKKTLFEDDAFQPVPQSERHGWWKTSFIWAGSSICVPTIMVGALMINGLSFLEMILAVVIGTGILSLVFCLQGTQGTDTGLPTVVLARSAFGRKGAGIIISFILASTLICWTGSDCQIAGESFIQILTLNGIEWNRNLVIIVLGLIMLTVSIFGEKLLSKLNIIAVPALIILCIYGIVTCLQSVSLIDLITASPVEPIRLVEGISMVVGMQAVGSTISPDYHRFCRNRKGSCLAAVVGIMPYCLFLFIAGAIMGAATGETDISILVAKLGLPFIGLAILDHHGLRRLHRRPCHHQPSAPVRHQACSCDRYRGCGRYSPGRIRHHGLLHQLPGSDGKLHSAGGWRDDRRLLAAGTR